MKIISAITIKTITNTTATSKTITLISKLRYAISAEMAAAPIPLTSITTTRKSTSKVMMAAKTSATMTSTMTTKETALIATPHYTQEKKGSDKKNLLSSLVIA